MRKLLVKAQTRAGAVVIGGALLAVAVGGVATAAVVTSTPATDEVSDVEPVTTEPTQTTAVPEPQTNVSAPVPADSPVVDTPAASVGGVTEPAPATIPEGHRLPDLAPGQDPEGVGTIGPNGNYTPAPPRQNPGEPPVGVDDTPPPVAEPDTPEYDLG